LLRVLLQKRSTLQLFGQLGHSKRQTFHVAFSAPSDKLTAGLVNELVWYVC
jgi:hypothetical protein